MARTSLIPPSLSLRLARNALLRIHDPETVRFSSAAYRESEGLMELKIPELDHLFDTLARKGDILGALDSFRRTGDPRATDEARALNFKTQFDRSISTITDLTRKTAAKLADDKARLRHDAFGKAGLGVDYGDRAEIRQVLRGMSDRDRNAAIDSAIKNRDMHVLTAVNAAHELLIGKTSLPVQTMIEQYVAETAPEETLKIAKLTEAEDYLSMAYGEVAKSAEAMRDLPAEERGESGIRAAKQAEASLALALSDLHPGAGA
jgi:hypothetical protein